MGKRIASAVFFSALMALLAWAAVITFWRAEGREALSAMGASSEGETASEEDVLFDDDSTVDWSDPITDVFDSTPQGSDVPAAPQPPKSYEFALTSDYFDALLEKYSDGIPIRSITSSFSSGHVILSGKADVDALTDLLNIPAALVVFLPDTVECRLACIPRVENGRLRVSVAKVWAGSDILAPFLSAEGILSSVEEFLNDLLMRYLPATYHMQSATVSDGGMYVRFSVDTEE